MVLFVLGGCDAIAAAGTVCSCVVYMGTTGAMSGAEAGGARVAVLGLGASGTQAADLTVSAVHHLHELSTLEHEEQVGIMFQQPRVEALGCLNGFTHPAFQHQLLDFCLFFMDACSS